MALHLITGYAGQEHITSADQGAYNMATYGEGQFVLNRGSKFRAAIISNNAIQIMDGEAMMQGRYIKLARGTVESLTIDNGTQGEKRNDLIVVRYTKDASTSIESATFHVIKGTPTTGAATDPEYIKGNITDGTSDTNDMPLYRVNIDGINITSVTPLFDTKESLVSFMDSMVIPIGSETRRGILQVGSGIGISNGTITGQVMLYNTELDTLTDISIPAENCVVKRFDEVFAVYDFDVLKKITSVSTMQITSVLANPYVRMECFSTYHGMYQSMYEGGSLTNWKIKFCNAKNTAYTIKAGSTLHASGVGFRY